jgi:hypothetical protein
VPTVARDSFDLAGDIGRPEAVGDEALYAQEGNEGELRGPGVGQTEARLGGGGKEEMIGVGLTGERPRDRF